MSGIFISYRREDSGGEAGRLYDRLSAHFGKHRVFMDVDAIEPGDDFAKTIDTRIASCDALIAVIGPAWLTSKDERGRRRLDDPQDFVRLEIVAALERDIRVIPALVDRAVTPRAEDLPDALAPLIRRNALEISSTAFHSSVDRLIEVLDKTGRKHTSVVQRPSRTTLTVSAVVVGLVLIAGATYWRTSGTADPPADSSHAAQDTRGPAAAVSATPSRSVTDSAVPVQPGPAAPKAVAPKAVAPPTPVRTQERNAPKQQPAETAVTQPLNAPAGQPLTSAAAYKKASALYDEKRFAEALPLFEQAAAANHIDAIESIAYMYHNGLGLKQDHQEWLKLTTRAAELGSRPSMNELAAAYQKGSFGIPANAELSLHWYRKLADAGDGEAMYRLGEFYEAGSMGVKQDIDQAISWYRKAAASDDNFAPDWAKQALKRLGK